MHRLKILPQLNSATLGTTFDSGGKGNQISMLNEPASHSEVLLTQLPLEIPGPKGNPFLGRLVRSSRRDPLRFMTTLAHEFGDVSTFRLGTERVVFVNHPDYVREVLVNHYSNFLKGAGNLRAKRFLGEGLLLSEGDLHRRQRRLAQPNFHHQKIAVYGEQMIDCAERCSARWQDGQTLDIWREMQRLTLDIVGKTLFSADVEAKDDEVGQAMRAATLQYRAFKLPFAKLFERLPLPHLLRFHRGKQRLRNVVLQLIEERRRDGADRGDLLSMLLLAEDEGVNGHAMTAEQVWDEALTIFIAGYDTTATALMWTWYLLSQHPEVEARVHAEIDSFLPKGQQLTFANLRQLPYTEQVLLEAMRIYPPTWRLGSAGGKRVSDRSVSHSRWFACCCLPVCNAPQPTLFPRCRKIRSRSLDGGSQVFKTTLLILSFRRRTQKVSRRRFRDGRRRVVTGLAGAEVAAKTRVGSQGRSVSRTPAAGKIRNADDY